MKLISLTCVHCGGSLETTASAELFRCQYCKQLMLLVRESGTAGLAATKLNTRQEWPANCLRPGDALNWQAGHLYLTAEALAFVPHSFNFGPLERAVVPVAIIKNTELVKGMLFSDDLTAHTTSGETWVYRVRKGQELQDAIEAARRGA